MVYLRRTNPTRFDWFFLNHAPLKLAFLVIAALVITPWPTNSYANHYIYGRVSAVFGDSAEEIYRAEAKWLNDVLNTDINLIFQNKDGENAQKHRVQFLPIKFDNAKFGLSYRWSKKQNDESQDALGLAMRFKSKHWKLPIRYYPELNLIHSKPAYKINKLRLECLTLYDIEKGQGTIRPAADWLFKPYFSTGIEARVDEDSDKNYIGLRLRLRLKKPLN